MPNTKQTRNTTQVSDNENQETKSVSSSRAPSMPSAGFDGENLLDQFATFMKANWRPLLMEAVAAGVTAYMTHASGNNGKTSKTHN